MKILNQVISLHERTKVNPFKSHVIHVELGQRLYMLPSDIRRIGQQTDDRPRTDLNITLVFYAYLARKIYINDNDYKNDYELQKENEFTLGLWDIFCIERIGRKVPEVNVPCTHLQLHDILQHKVEYLKFSHFDTVREAVFYNNLIDSGECMRMEDFDLHCRLPSEPSWTASQHYASLTDGRKGCPLRLMQIAIGMYMYDLEKVPEPYPHFWIERADRVIKKLICLSEKRYMTRFRRATVFENQIHDRFTNQRVYREIMKTYQWNPTHKK